jgi:hypothetical protein
MRCTISPASRTTFGFPLTHISGLLAINVSQILQLSNGCLISLIPRAGISDVICSFGPISLRTSAPELCATDQTLPIFARLFPPM